MKSTFKLLTIVLIVLFASCKKEIEDKQNKIILLTKPSGWVTSKLEQKLANGSWVDITGNIGAFEADNLLIFDPWYSWAIDERVLKLPGSPQIPFSGTWSFTDKETKIQFKDGNLLEIVELTETAFIVTTVSNGETVRYTYRHP